MNKGVVEWLKYHLLYFGDGIVCNIRKRFPPYKNAEGIEVVKFIIKPSKRLAIVHEIKKEELNDNEELEIEIPLNLVYDPPQDPRTGANRTWVLCDVRKNDNTDLGNLQKELLGKLNEKDGKIVLLEDEVAYLKKLIENIQKFDEEYTKRLLDRIPDSLKKEGEPGGPR